MNVENWFATPIFFDRLEIDLQPIKQFCLSLQQSENSINVSNVNGWHSKYYPVNSFVELQHLENLLQEKINESCKMLSNTLKLNLSHIWININDTLGFNKPHVHPNSAFSGCFYVDVPLDSGRIYFETPVKDKFHYPIDTQNIPLFFDRIYYNPEPGKVLLFPSWLFHGVEENKTNQKRISIAFNTTQEF